jgi:Ras family protein
MQTDHNCAGKSSLTVRYCEGHFVEAYYPTIENTFSREIQYKGQNFLTEIIDTQGQVKGSLRVAMPTG